MRTASDPRSSPKKSPWQRHSAAPLHASGQPWTVDELTQRPCCGHQKQAGSAAQLEQVPWSRVQVVEPPQFLMLRCAKPSLDRPRALGAATRRAA